MFIFTLKLIRVVKQMGITEEKINENMKTIHRKVQNHFNMKITLSHKRILQVGFFFSNLSVQQRPEC